MGVTIKLIDDAKFILSNNVTGDVSWLDLTMQLVTKISLNDARRELEKHKETIDHPPYKYFLFFNLGVDKQKMNEAYRLKVHHERKIDAIQRIVTLLHNHTSWLEEQCKIIKTQCEDERNRLKKLSGIAEGLEVSRTSLLGNLNISKIGDKEKKDFTVALLVFLKEINDEATKYMNAKERRKRRSLPSQPISDRGAESTDVSLDVASGNTAANLVLDLQPVRSLTSAIEKSIILLNVSRSAVEIQLADVTDGLLFSFLNFRSIFQEKFPTSTESSSSPPGKSQKQAEGKALAPSLPDVAEFASDSSRFLSFWRDNIYKIRDIKSGLRAFADSQKELPLNSRQVKLKNRGIRDKVDAKGKEVLRTLEDVERDVQAMINKAAEIVNVYAGMYKNFGCGRNRDYCTELATAVLDRNLKSLHLALINVRYAKQFYLF